MHIISMKRWKSRQLMDKAKKESLNKQIPEKRLPLMFFLCKNTHSRFSNFFGLSTPKRTSFAATAHARALDITPVTWSRGSLITPVVADFGALSLLSEVIADV